MVDCKMKKILCLIDSIGPGGAQRQLVGLATFLKECGYEITVLCYHDNSFYLEQLQRNDIPYFYLEKAQNAIFRIWHIARYMRKNKPDVVISYLETPSICACVAKFFNRSFKLIVSERSTTQHTGRNERIRFNLFRVADYVVPNAYSQKKYIIDHFPTLTNKTITIPNFVDLDYFTPVYKQRRYIPEIMVAASIWALKNTLGFIDAVYLLKEKGLQFHISWYGNNNEHIEYINKCQEKIDEYGVGDYITLKDKTTQIKKCYQEADFFCLPSFYEGTPNVICEAMACGLPIACSNVCDNGLYVVDEENGYLFDPKDKNSMADAMEKMLSLDKDGYDNYSKASRARAEAMFSNKRFLELYINLIET